MTAPELPPMPFEPEPDQVAGPLSDALLGVTLEYAYSGGRRYRLIFDDYHHVTFEMLDHPLHGNPDGMTAPTLDYRAREVRDGLVLVHWIVKEAAIHVALTVDLEQRRISAAAMMPPNRWEFFDTGEIVSITRSLPG